MIDKFISCMKEQGWTVERNEKQRFCLPEPMKSRYTGYPESWVEFVSIVKTRPSHHLVSYFLQSKQIPSSFPGSRYIGFSLVQSDRISVLHSSLQSSPVLHTV